MKKVDMTIQRSLKKVPGLGKPQKNNGIFLVARPLRGGRVRAWPLRKRTFFEAQKKIGL